MRAQRALRGVTHFYQGTAEEEEEGPAGNDDANLKNSIRIQRQFVACCPNAACNMRRHMPHVAHVFTQCATRDAALFESREGDYLVRLRLQANPFGHGFLPLAINAIRRTIVRHAKRQSDGGRGRAETAAEAEWPLRP